MIPTLRKVMIDSLYDNNFSQGLYSIFLNGNEYFVTFKKNTGMFIIKDHNTIVLKLQIKRV